MSGTPKAAGGGPPPPPPSGQAKAGAAHAPLPPPPPAGSAAKPPPEPRVVPVAPAPIALPRLLTLSVPVLEPPPGAELAIEVPGLERDAAASTEGSDRKRTTMELLLELDAPGHESRAEDRKRSTAEFLFELDAPARATSQEIDVDADRELEIVLAHASASSTDAGAEAGMETDTSEPLPEPEPTLASDVLPAAAQRPLRERIELLVSLPAQAKARTAQEQLQQRLRRVVVRVLTCRDCFRWLGVLGIPDEDRKSVARMFMALDQAVPPSEGQPSVVKDPEVALKRATPEQLDDIEHRVTPIEDKLLMIDELVAPESFQIQIENRKQSKKIVARYGRLLASRRFPAGQRRDRFELIATHLLTTVSEDGRRHPLPPDRARAVLEVLIGGLPHKNKAEELDEALAHLGDMLDRLGTFTAHHEFFDSDYFLDMHGYKVMMRDHLLSPEFVYLSVLLDAEMHNRLETFILDATRLHDSNQLTSEGTPREQIERRMAEQRDAVDDMLGVKRPLPAVGRAEAPKAAAPAKKKAKKKKKARAPLFELAFDRQTITLLVTLLVILGVGGVLAFQTGAVGVEIVQPLDEAQLAQLSPLLARGWIKGEGDASHFDGMVFSSQWLALDPRKRTEQAEQVLKALAAKGVKNAKISGPAGPAIEIHDALVTFVEGGKL